MARGAEGWPAGRVVLGQGPQPSLCTQMGPGEVCPVSCSSETRRSLSEFGEGSSVTSHRVPKGRLGLLKNEVKEWRPSVPRFVIPRMNLRGTGAWLREAWGGSVS